MSYTTENAKDQVEKHMLVLMRPRIRRETWTVVSGSVYSNPFAFGYVTAVSVNGVTLALGSSAVLSATQYYYDASAQLLYIRKTSGSPSASDWIVVTFELYLCDKEINWYRDPTDSTSLEVCWRGVIQQPPAVKRTVTDSIFGFSPVLATSVGCDNDPEYFQEILYGLSMNLAEVVIYHLAGNLDVGNIQKLFTGVGADYSFTDKSVTFDILDKAFIFDKTLDNGSSPDVYPQTGVEPSYTGSGVPTIYGLKHNIRLIGLNEGTGFAAMSDSWGLLWTFPVTASSMTTKTVSLANAAAIKKAFDLGWNGITASLTSQLISDVNTSTGVITHSNDATAGMNDITIRPFKEFTFVQNDSGYDESFYAGYKVPAVSGYVSAEYQGVGTAPDPIQPGSDFYICDFLGARISPTISGSTFGSFYNPFTILYHILKDRLGLTESEIDTAAFLSLASDSDRDFICAFSTIAAENGDQPKYRDVITRLLTTCLCNAYIDESGVFCIKAVGPAAAADFTFVESDLMEPSYSAVTRDISSVRVVGARKNWVLVDSTGSVVFNEPYKVKSDQYEYDKTAEIDAVSYLHEIENERVIETYFYDFVDSGIADQTYADRIATLIGDRLGTLSTFIKSGAHGVNIGDTVAVVRTKQPGYAYDGETEYTRNYVVVEISKEIGGVLLILDDQKGIEDNTGDW